jgi:hypothetical protein
MAAIGGALTYLIKNFFTTDLEYPKVTEEQKN